MPEKRWLCGLRKERGRGFSTAFCLMKDCPVACCPWGVARANRVVVGVRVCWASTELL
jgi:hypothetical protein